MFHGIFYDQSLKQVENNYVIEYVHDGLDKDSANNLNRDKDVKSQNKNGHQPRNEPPSYENPDEISNLKAELASLKAENDLLRISLNQQFLQFNQFQTDYKTREKLVNEELKNLRKKVFFLLKKSVVNNYTTDEEDEPDSEERVIHF